MSKQYQRTKLMLHRKQVIAHYEEIILDATIARDESDKKISKIFWEQKIEHYKNEIARLKALKWRI